jgi:DNA replication ATP-dependent helicase Dna2
MVSALLETVNGEIKKSRSIQLKPDSVQKRSPQRKSPGGQGSARQSPRHQPGSSPLAKKSTGGKGGDNGVDLTSEEKASSDYGDDDFDDETLLELDASILGQGDDSTVVVSSEESNQQAPPVQKAIDDEFNDFDDDFFDGAEDLVAEVAAKHTYQQSTARLGAADDDAYGNDFDDIDFDAVELAATQATSRPFSTNVRTAG